MLKSSNALCHGNAKVEQCVTNMIQGGKTMCFAHKNAPQFSVKRFQLKLSYNIVVEKYMVDFGFDEI